MARCAVKVTHTSQFAELLSSRMGFAVHQIQTDNGREFTNPGERERRSASEDTLTRLEISYRRTRPYPRWQNGVVELSHRLDAGRFYASHRFGSEEERKRSLARYENRYNRTTGRVLNFRSPNEVLKEYLEETSSRPLGREDLPGTKVVNPLFSFPPCHKCLITLDF